MQRDTRSISLDVCDYTNKPLCNLYDSAADISGQAADVYVHKERNGFKELRFTLPSVCIGEEGEEPNYRFTFLKSDFRIKFQSKSDDNNIETDWFLISEDKITHTVGKKYEIRASHISQLLKTKKLDLEFSDEYGNNVGTIKEIASTIFEGTGWHLGKVASFLEEEVFLTNGEKKEKVRTFRAASKTGAFKLMSDLCELFDAKPIYHGEGLYQATDSEGNFLEENGEPVMLKGRTVDILPLNPFSNKVREGDIPSEVIENPKVLELHYGINTKNISRVRNTDNIVTKLSAYGSYGDLNGLCSLQRATHDVLTFTGMTVGTDYHFVWKNQHFYFTAPSTESEWSSLDLFSRTYVSYVQEVGGQNVVGWSQVQKEKNANSDPVNITPTVRTERNYFPFVMDFSYYRKVGLFSDDMMTYAVNYQKTMPENYRTAEENSLALSAARAELLKTASDGEGFVKLDVHSYSNKNGNLMLTLDGVEFRSDYDSNPRNYFSWRPAQSLKDDGQPLAGIGAVVYIVKRGTPTEWVKTYVKSLGDGEYDYYYDRVGNKYLLKNQTEYTGTDGTEGVLYYDSTEKKYYAWTGEYVEVLPSPYEYGTKAFEEPKTITLWTSYEDYSGCEVYLFSADAIAGLFGPREDQAYSNEQAIKKSTEVVASEVHPFYFAYKDANGRYTVPPHETETYGWYYVLDNHSINKYEFGELYFYWSEVPNSTWHKVIVKFNSDPLPALTNESLYLYDAFSKMFYFVENNEWTPVKDTVDKDRLTANFASVITGCIRQEVLIKGVAETYSYNPAEDIVNNVHRWEDDELPVGSYAFRTEFGNYWLFKTDVLTDHEIVYKTDKKRLWLDDTDDLTTSVTEVPFDSLDYPKPNELKDIAFEDGKFSNNIFDTTSKEQKLSGNIYTYENTAYECSLPSNTTVVFLSSENKVLSSVVPSGTFTAPNHCTHIRIAYPSSGTLTDSHYIRVQGYEYTVFYKGIRHIVLPCTASGTRTGLPDLMDSFMDKTEEIYNVKLPALRAAQKAITDANIALAEEIGDMYREGTWQKSDYVDGDENKLYSDSLDNLKEISKPQCSYSFGYIDIYNTQQKIGLAVDDETDDVNWPDIDIDYAAHLVDEDIDINCWAYIDKIDKCYTDNKKTTIEINTKLSTIGQQSFTDVLASIAQVANEVKSKQTIYDRAGNMTSNGVLVAEKVQGMLQANRVFISGGTSNFYTDQKGNMIFEDANGESAMMLSGRGWAISSTKDAFGDWEWTYIATGKGLSADAISSGRISGKLIEAHSLSADKLQAGVGQELDISSNKALYLYATSDGARPSGSVDTLYDKDDRKLAGDSYIEIKAKDENEEARINILSGGEVNVAAGGSLNLHGANINIQAHGDPQDSDYQQGNINIKAGGSLKIESGSDFLVDSPNFNISKDQYGNYSLDVRGVAHIESGDIGGFNIAQEYQNIVNQTTGATEKQWVRGYIYSGNVTSPNTLNQQGVYVGTDGLNIAGKLRFSADGSTASLNIDASDIHFGNTTLESELEKAIQDCYMCPSTGTGNIFTKDYNVGDYWKNTDQYDNNTYVCVSRTTNKSWIDWHSIQGTEAFYCPSVTTPAQGNVEEVEGIDKKNYNVGDTWVNTDEYEAGKSHYYKYTCVSTGNKGTNNYLNDWVANKNITGASLNIDADEGKINLLANSSINLTGGSINLDSNSSINIRAHDSGDFSGIVLDKDGIGISSTQGIYMSTVSSNQDVTVLAMGNLTPIDSSYGTGFYLGTTGVFEIESNKFRISDGNVEVQGKITAESGSIGGWTIGDDFIGSGDTVTASKIGLGNQPDYVFWAGSNDRGASSQFSVTPAGKVACSDLIMTGGFICGNDINISASSIELETEESVSGWSGFASDKQYYVGDRIQINGVGYVAKVNTKRQTFMSSEWQEVTNHILLKSGASFIELTPTKIDMNSAGLIRLTGKDVGNNHSFIKFTNANGTNTFFEATSTGAISCKDLSSGSISVTGTTTSNTVEVTHLRVTGDHNLSIPVLRVSSTQPSGHGFYWIKLNGETTTTQSTKTWSFYVYLGASGGNGTSQASYVTSTANNGGDSSLAGQIVNGASVSVTFYIKRYQGAQYELPASFTLYAANGTQLASWSGNLEVNQGQINNPGWKGAFDTSRTVSNVTYTGTAPTQVSYIAISFSNAQDSYGPSSYISSATVTVYKTETTSTTSGTGYDSIKWIP